VNNPSYEVLAMRLWQLLNDGINRFAQSNPAVQFMVILLFVTICFPILFQIFALLPPKAFIIAVQVVMLAFVAGVLYVVVQAFRGK